MQLEAISTVPVSHLTFEALWQVDNFDCLKGASLDAHTAAVTKVL